MVKLQRLFANIDVHMCYNMGHGIYIYTHFIYIFYIYIYTCVHMVYIYLYIVSVTPQKIEKSLNATILGHYGCCSICFEVAPKVYGHSTRDVIAGVAMEESMTRKMIPCRAMIGRNGCEWDHYSCFFLNGSFPRSLRF